MINPDTLQVKIIDFGFAKFVGHEVRAHPHAGWEGRGGWVDGIETLTMHPHFTFTMQQEFPARASATERCFF